MLPRSTYPSNVDQTHLEPQPTGRSLLPTAASCRPILTALRTIYDGFRESLIAHRQYERLRSRGIPHDMALRASLGVAPCKVTRQTAKPLHFAGKA
jgi:hypothetical protein